MTKETNDLEATFHLASTRARLLNCSGRDEIAIGMKSNKHNCDVALILKLDYKSVKKILEAFTTLEEIIIHRIEDDNDGKKCTQ